MSGHRSAARTKPGAESAEVRNASNGAGSRAAGKCGESAEVVRKLSLSHSVPAVPALPAPSAGRRRRAPAAAAPLPALPLVPPVPVPPREEPPAEAPTRASGGPWGEAPPSLARGLPAPEQAVIDAALAILARRVREPGALVESPGAARELVRMHLAQCERERFGVLFLDARHAVIGWEVLFEGTLTQTAVYPREVVRRALQLNAAAVIVAHNHPSGSAEPSQADEYLAAAIQSALSLIDVRLLDSFVVGWPAVVSMAERDLIRGSVPAWAVRPAAVSSPEAPRRRSPQRRPHA